MSFVAFVAAMDYLPACGVLRHELDVSIPVSSPPLHILKCVWLC